MVDVAQLVRAADCGSVGRGFESHLPPQKAAIVIDCCFFYTPKFQVFVFTVENTNKKVILYSTLTQIFLSFVLKLNNQINLYVYVFRNSRSNGESCFH